MYFVYPQNILHKVCFQFLLGRLQVPREIENNAYAKVLGVNKVHNGQCGSGELSLIHTIILCSLGKMENCFLLDSCFGPSVNSCHAKHPASISFIVEQQRAPL